MFPNLKAEMARINMTVKDLSEKIGVKDTWLENRLNGKSVMPIETAFAIWSKCFSRLTLDYLFAQTAIVPVAKQLQKTENDNA